MDQTSMLSTRTNRGINCGKEKKGKASRIMKQIEAR